MTEETATEEAPSAVSEASETSDAPVSLAKPVYGQISIEEFEVSEYSEAEQEQLEAMYDESFSGIRQGEIVQGRVVNVNQNEVLVDIGFKSEGAISIREFGDPTAIEIG
ncbi:MAG: S1 RNA-binding domain-containing protein, partial [Gemmatimonadetes bacterium]|nr:S1 RNA-binding domain-containing protein [Gemmatimonadota bacterium]